MKSHLLFTLLILFASLFSTAQSVSASAGISINESQLAQNDIIEEFEEEISGEESEKSSKKKKKEKDKDEISLSGDFFLSLLINLLTVIVIVRFIYYPNYKNQDSLFTYFLFNIIVFMLMYLLNQIKISLGAAFGLFAVFSMLRYRTENITTKDMTYLFIVIAIGLISAVRLEIYELLMINSVIVLITFALDGNILFKRLYSKVVQYENIELIKPEHNAELIADLKQRTGLNIQKIYVGKMDFLRDTAAIRIYYHE